MGGSSASVFQRACVAGNVMMAVATSYEFPQPLVLGIALDLVALFARVGDQRYDAAAVRWLERFIGERRPTLAAARIAAEALLQLPDEAAERVLRELLKRRQLPGRA